MSAISPGRVALSFSLLLALAACAADPAGGGASRAQAPERHSDMLAQTNWELARWTRPGGALRPVPHGGAGKTAPITLSFTHQRGAARLAGFAGCNNYSGQYTIANGLLIVTAPPVSTRMACANADLARLEQDYLAGLTAVTASRLDHDTRPQRLTLALRSGDVLDFARRADPLAGGQPGAAKLVYVASSKAPCSAGAGRAQCYQVRDSASSPGCCGTGTSPVSPSSPASNTGCAWWKCATPIRRPTRRGCAGCSTAWSSSAWRRRVQPPRRSALAGLFTITPCFSFVRAFPP